VKKNLLHFTSCFPLHNEDSSGIFIKQLASQTKCKFNTFVLTPNDKKSNEHEIVDGIEVIRYNYFIKKYQKLVYGDSIIQNLKSNKFLYFQIPFFLFSALINLTKTIINKKINIIHAHWIFPQGTIAVIAKKIVKKKIKIVVTSHGGDAYGLNGYIFNKIKQFTLNNVEVITAVSTPIKEKIHKELNINQKKIAVIPMGTDDKIFNNKNNDSSQIQDDFILFVGRLSEKKGVIYLINAFYEIQKTIKNLKLIIIGNGLEHNSLLKEANRLKVLDKTIFTGSMPQDKIIPYYKSAKIFIAPSIISKSGDTEGFGLVFIEAMLSKCPVIGTKTGGISDIITHEKTGLLVEQKNPNQLAEAIKRLLDDEELRQKLITNGYQYAKENFTWDVIGKKYISEYDQLIKNRV
jgi:glycosyltransferase involved in cell wall biosynthesis